MNENKKYYWLKLKEDFFEDDAIEWLEEQKPNGRDYAYFYLKLCLKSLKSNGHLIRQVGDILIPYDNKKLAEMTRMDFDTVTIAMELLKKIGLVKILESGELYLTQLEEMVGSESKWAKYKRNERQSLPLENGELDIVQCVSKKCPNRDRDRDRDRNKELDSYLYTKTNSSVNTRISRDSVSARNSNKPILESNYNTRETLCQDNIQNNGIDIKVYEYLEQAFGRTIGSYEYEKIENWKWEYNELTKFAIDYAVARPAKNVNYINTILNDFKDKGITTVKQAKEQLERNSKNRNRAQSEEEVQAMYDKFLGDEK